MQIAQIITWICGLLSIVCFGTGLIFYAVAKLTKNENGLSEGQMMGFFIGGAAAAAAAIVFGFARWTFSAAASSIWLGAL